MRLPTGIELHPASPSLFQRWHAAAPGLQLRRFIWFSLRLYKIH